MLTIRKALIKIIAGTPIKTVPARVNQGKGKANVAPK